jgi:micrococcal nuclease
MISAAGCRPDAPRDASAHILDWIDGDTAYVLLGGERVKVGLIGVMDRAVGFESPEFHAATLEIAPPGAAAVLEFDVRERDRHGRLLAYMWLPDGRMVNEELLRAGLVVAHTAPPNVLHAERLLAAEREARDAWRGVWRPSW